MDPLIIFMVVIIAIGIFFLIQNTAAKSSFYGTLNNPPDTLVQGNQPMNFPKLNTPVQNIESLSPPDVPEEIGLGMVYPQGDGVGMSPTDSNSFYPGNPGPLLTTFVNPESYGESSLTDPTGLNGSDQGARVLRIKNTGNQMGYKPLDMSMKSNFSAAYSDSEIQKGAMFINGSQEIKYDDPWNPEDNLLLQTSPGQQSNLTNCEQTYPNVVKYGDLCITEGDIPYGQVVDGKVNPRLVSRWESFTGDYSREAALNPIDGVLYPNLSVLTN